MKVVLLSADLMVVSRAQGAASRTGAELRTLASPEQATPLTKDQPAELLIVDLATPGLDLGSLVNSIRAASATVPRIVAFGPHVHEERLAAARDAGCDEVISRGQFFSQLESILDRDAGQRGN